MYKICFPASHNGNIIRGWVAGSGFCVFLYVVIFICGDSLRACNMDLKLLYGCRIKESLNTPQTTKLVNYKLEKQFFAHLGRVVKQIDWIALSN